MSPRDDFHPPVPAESDQNTEHQHSRLSDLALRVVETMTAFDKAIGERGQYGSAPEAFAHADAVGDLADYFDAELSTRPIEGGAPSLQRTLSEPNLPTGMVSALESYLRTSQPLFSTAAEREEYERQIGFVISHWTPLRKAIWKAVTDENLNGGHYIKAKDLTDKIHDAVFATGMVMVPSDEICSALAACRGALEACLTAHPGNRGIIRAIEKADAILSASSPTVVKEG